MCFLFTSAYCVTANVIRLFLKRMTFVSELISLELFCYAVTIFPQQVAKEGHSLTVTQAFTRLMFDLS